MTKSTGVGRGAGGGWKNGSPWTAEEDTQIRRLAAEGLAASTIAGRLPGRTRCAVIGRGKRLRPPVGFHGHPPNWGKGKRRGRNGHKGALKKMFAKLAGGGKYELPEVPAQAPQPRGLLLVQLMDRHCRWPLNGACACGKFSYSFCGADNLDLGPYCPFHHQLGVCERAATNQK